MLLKNKGLNVIVSCFAKTIVNQCRSETATIEDLEKQLKIIQNFVDKAKEIN